MTRAVKKKLKAIAENTKLVYDAGVEIGKAEGGGGVTELYYATDVAAAFAGATFPENYEFSAEIEKGSSIGSMFDGATGLKSIKLKSTINSEAISASLFARRCHTLETIDLSEYNTRFLNFSYFALEAVNLKYVLGELDLTDCTNVASCFGGTNFLEEVRFKENTINISLSIYSPKLSAETINSLINGLKPTAVGVTRTLTLSADVKNKLTDEQIATITQTKGWSLA